MIFFSIAWWPTMYKTVCIRWLLLSSSSHERTELPKSTIFISCSVLLLVSFSSIRIYNWMANLSCRANLAKRRPKTYLACTVINRNTSRLTTRNRYNSQVVLHSILYVVLQQGLFSFHLEQPRCCIDIALELLDNTCQWLQPEEASAKWSELQKNVLHGSVLWNIICRQWA